MEFYSATKKNEILSFAGKCMELENSMLSEVSQAQEAKATCFLSYVESLHFKRLINLDINMNNLFYCLTNKKKAQT
jgi:hypothetical protein